MPQNIIEYARQLSIEQLFSPTNSFIQFWQDWKAFINTNYLSNPPTEYQVFSLGDHLSDVFLSTRHVAGRTQGGVSSGGANWEALICWYLNLCLIGRRTIVIKHNRNLIPTPIQHAITVNYHNFTSNTESDLIAISFPDREDYRVDKETIEINDTDGNPVDTIRRNRYQFLPVIDALAARDFGDLDVHIIQCKTNWNDDAQIPMLWDAVYSASAFRNGVSVGIQGRSIRDINDFTYSFVTVPTNGLTKPNGDRRYKNDSTAVLRVAQLSGGNYWGYPSEQGVAASVKEILDRHLRSGHENGILSTIRLSLAEIGTTYGYFNLL